MASPETSPWATDGFHISNNFFSTKLTNSLKTVSAHAFLYSDSTACLFGYVNMRYAIMLQHRFDGMLGFPGGLVTPGEDITDGLNRELQEEIGLEPADFLSDSNYFKTWVSSSHVSHIYIKKYSEMRLKKMEENALHSQDWGGENLGIMRVPVHYLKSSSRELPFVRFLQHNFVANAKEQLIECLVSCNIFKKDEMLKIWKRYKEISKS